MTRVGNEIDAHLFGGDDIGRVEHANEDRLIRQGSDRKTPRPPRFGNARHLEVRGSIGEHLLERLRMADGETHILPLNPAEQTSSPCVRQRYRASFDQQRGFLERFDQRADVG